MVNYVLASHRGRSHILTKAHEPSAYGERTFLESREPTLTSSGWASEYRTSRWRSLVASTAQWVNSAASSVGAMVGGICPARALQGPGYLLRRVGIDVDRRSH